MTDVLRACALLDAGRFHVDQRLNYEKGLPLGAAEFRLEQRYLLERDQRHQRSIHGYGTVEGLAVTTEPVGQGDDADVEIRVSTGFGIDQMGQPILVRTPQCARLGAWLKAQRIDLEGKLPTVDLNIGDGVHSAQFVAGNGKVRGNRIWVVALSDECGTDLRPIPGCTCATEDESRAPSRIQDSWRIELRWVPPGMPVWHAAQQFADLLLSIIWQKKQPTDASPDALKARVDTFVQALGDAAGDPMAVARAIKTLDASPGLKLWSTGARTVIDGLLRRWAVEIRPLLSPGGVLPNTDLTEGAIVLASVFVPLVPVGIGNQSGDHPVDGHGHTGDDEAMGLTDLHGATVDNSERPMLAPTQLLQELLLLGVGSGVTVSGETPPPRPPREIVTVIDADDVDGQVPGLRALGHLPGNLNVVFSGAPGAPNSWVGTPATSSGVADATLANGSARELRLGVAPAPGQLVGLAIDLDRSTVDEGLAAQSSLADYLAAHDLEVVNREGSVAWIYHQIRQATPDPVPEPVKTVLLPPNLITTRSTVRRADDNQQVTECRLDVWLHLDVIDPAPGSPQGDEYELAAEGEELSNFVGVYFEVQTAPDPPTVVDLGPQPIRIVHHNQLTILIEPALLSDLVGQVRDGVHLRVHLVPDLPLRRHNDSGPGDPIRLSEVLVTDLPLGDAAELGLWTYIYVPGWAD